MKSFRSVTLAFSAILLVFYKVAYSQPDFDKVISERISASPAFTPKKPNPPNSGLVRIEVVGLNYSFESLPLISYDIKNASFVPEDVVLENYKFPNCTSQQQAITENFKLTIALKRQVIVNQSDFSSNKFSFGFQVPIYAVVVNMSDEMLNTTTVSQSVTKEETVTREFSRNTPFTIPPNKTTIIKVVAKRGVIRVPFQATFKVDGTAAIVVWYKIFGDVKHSDVIVINIRDALNDQARTFNFGGYVTNDNSSDLSISYAETPNNKNDCVKSQETLDTSENKEVASILGRLKNKYALANERAKAIKLPHPISGLVYHPLFSKKQAKTRLKSKNIDKTH